MITAVVSHAHGDGAFEVRVHGDADTISGLAAELTARMLAREESGPATDGKALSTTDLRHLITFNGDTAAVRDRDGNVWRWQKNGSWHCGEYDTYLHIETHALHRDYSPLTEA